MTRAALLLVAILLAPALASCGPKGPSASPPGFCAPEEAPRTEPASPSAGAAAAGALGCEVAAAGR
jgi:predicted small lipoprotein YifL